jgi:hypothetical protein
VKKLLTFFSLFGSVSTLLCCALPVTLVSIGMGASFAALTANVPQLIWLVERKNWLFAITAILLVSAYLLMQNARRLACPVDSEQRELCEDSKSISTKIFWVSVAFYGIGFCFSYVIPLFM